MTLRKNAARAFLAFSLALAGVVPGAGAQDVLPQLPPPIKNLVDEGAQIRYLGRDHGLDAWITIKKGQEQYFYVLPDRSAFVMGILFDSTGKAVTIQQVQKLRSQGDEILDVLTSDFDAREAAEQQEDKTAFDFKSPAEQLFYDIENSNWVPFGQAGAPVLYAFIDPQCPHCHEFMKDLRAGDYLSGGKLQLRMIPVGFKNETQAQAAFLLAAPNPQDRWFRHMDGDSEALPAKSEINQQGVQRNLALMQSWEFDVTPMIFYRGRDGTVKIVRGRPQDLDGLIADIGSRT